MPGKSLCFALVLGLLGAGCGTTVQISDTASLTRPRTTGVISVYATDGAIYRLIDYDLRDSLLAGVGTVTRLGQCSAFQGSVLLDSIGYVEAHHRSVLKGALFVGAAGAVIALADLSSDGFNVTETAKHYPEYTGGSSCPFIYSWAGDRRTLEGEAIAVALGRAAEMTTSTMLPAIEPDEHGRLRVTIANERFETHQLNRVEMVRYDVQPGTRLVLDESGTAWPVAACRRPVAAEDASGRDAMNPLRSPDGLFWESDLREVTPGSSFQDRLECTFVSPDLPGEVSLVVRAINTTLSGTITEFLDRLLGESWLAFVHAIEHDPEMIGIMRQWTADASLEVAVWDGRSWQTMGRVLPEANVVPFTRLVRCRVPAGAGDTLKVRLSSLTGVWRLDSVALDPQPSRSLPGTNLPLVEARSASTIDPAPSIASEDSAYETLVRGQQLEATFQDSPEPRRGSAAYALRVRGWLYEWQDLPPESSAEMLMGVSAEDKIEYIKEMIGHKSLFLPPIYAAWKDATRLRAGG